MKKRHHQQRHQQRGCLRVLPRRHLTGCHLRKKTPEDLLFFLMCGVGRPSLKAKKQHQTAHRSSRSAPPNSRKTIVLKEIFRNYKFLFKVKIPKNKNKRKEYCQGQGGRGGLATVGDPQMGDRQSWGSPPLTGPPALQSLPRWNNTFLFNENNGNDSCRPFSLKLPSWEECQQFPEFEVPW